MGVFYRSAMGMHLIRNDLSTVPVSPGLNLYVQSKTFVSATYSEKDHRVVWWLDSSGGNECLCFDTEANLWSTWLPSRSTVAAAQLRDGRAFAVDVDGSNIDLSYYETDVYNGVTVNPTWRTAWLQPLGLHGRIQWDRVVFTARQLASHVLTIYLYVNGDDSAYVSSAVFTPADLSAELTGEIYTVEATDLFTSLAYARARAIMLEVMVAPSTSTEGARPLGMRVEYRTDGMRRRLQYGAGGRK